MTLSLAAVALLVAAGVIHARASSTRSAGATNPSSETSTARRGAPIGSPTSAAGRSSPVRVRSTTTVALNGPPWSVAQTTLIYTDPSRSTPARGSEAAHAGRVLRTVIRWPVTRGGVLSPGSHPLVVFAHGYAVSTNTYSALLDDLAAAGMIVAAPEFPGESAALSGPPDEADLVNEPCDLNFVAAALERQPPAALTGALAVAPLAFVGHSDGATAAASAGYSRNGCNGLVPVVVVALSPDDIPVNKAFHGSAPVLLAATGTADEINPVSHTEKLWLHVPPPAWLLTVNGGTHLGTFTTDPDRPDVDAIIGAFILAHTVDPRAGSEIVATGRLNLYKR